MEGDGCLAGIDRDRNLHFSRVAKINFGPELRVVAYEATVAWYSAAALDAPDHRLLTKGWKSATKGQVLKRLCEIQAP